jgi:hypothetical protein
MLTSKIPTPKMPTDKMLTSKMLTSKMPTSKMPTDKMLTISLKCRHFQPLFYMTEPARQPTAAPNPTILIYNASVVKLFTVVNSKVVRWAPGVRS